MRKWTEVKWTHGWMSLAASFLLALLLIGLSACSSEESESELDAVDSNADSDLGVDVIPDLDEDVQDDGEADGSDVSDAGDTAQTDTSEDGSIDMRQVEPQEIYVYFFGPSMFDISPAGSLEDGDGVRVRPENLARSAGLWMCDAAVAGGHTCRADGSFASTLTPISEHYVTLGPGQTYEDRWHFNHRHGENSCQAQGAEGFGDCSPAFNVALLTNNNFWWQPDENGNPYIASGGAESMDSLIEAWRSEATNTAADSRFFLYVWPPELDGNVSYDSWRNNDAITGWEAYQTANLDMVDAMQHGADVRLIPINQLWAEVLAEGGLLEDAFTDVDDFSWDSAPHGYWWFYMYSNMITTMVITESPIPADYQLPTLPEGPGFASVQEIDEAGGIGAVPPTLRQNFRAVMDYWWMRLNQPDLAPRVFSR